MPPSPLGVQGLTKSQVKGNSHVTRVSGDVRNLGFRLESNGMLVYISLKVVGDNGNTFDSVG